MIDVIAQRLAPVVLEKVYGFINGYREGDEMYNAEVYIGDTMCAHFAFGTGQYFFLYRTRTHVTHGQLLSLIMQMIIGLGGTECRIVLDRFPTEEEERRQYDASMQEIHNQRYAIAEVDHALPNISNAQPSQALTAQSPYTQNRVNPNSAVYLRPNLDADGRVTALYDWDNVKSTLGQTPIQSPSTRLRMHPSLVRQIIQRNKHL